jgi:hypothetical protein
VPRGAGRRDMPSDAVLAVPSVGSFWLLLFVFVLYGRFVALGFDPGDFARLQLYTCIGGFISALGRSVGCPAPADSCPRALSPLSDPVFVLVVVVVVQLRAFAGTVHRGLAGRLVPIRELVLVARRVVRHPVADHDLHVLLRAPARIHGPRSLSTSHVCRFPMGRLVTGRFADRHPGRHGPVRSEYRRQ